MADRAHKGSMPRASMGQAVHDKVDEPEPELSGGAKFMKFMLLFLNLFMLLAGLGMTVGGLILKFKPDMIGSIQAFSIFWYVALGLGGAITLFSVIAFIGTIKESRVILIIFSFLMFVLFVASAGAAVLILAKPDMVIGKFRAQYSKAVDGAKTPKATIKSYRKNMLIADAIHSGFECCGQSGPDDFGKDKKNFPDSCCMEDVKKGCAADNAKLWQMGCHKHIATKFGNAKPIVVGGLAGIAALLLLVFVFHICVICAIFKRNREMEEQDDTKKQMYEAIAEPHSAGGPPPQ